MSKITFGKIAKGGGDWETVKEFGKGSVQVHSWVDKEANDYKSIVQCATHFAKEGKRARVLPKVHFKNEMYKELFGTLVGTRYERKCPDFTAGENYYEYESFIGKADKTKVKNMVSRGLRQSSRIIIGDAKATDHYLHRLAHAHREEGKKVDEIWVLNKKGKLRLAYKYENPN